MAKKDKQKELRQKSRFADMEALRPQPAFPVPPRKAMSMAKKASKKLAYPVAPYAGAGPVRLLRWGQDEWWRLGKWQRLALPFIIYSALRTWEIEKGRRETYEVQVEQADTRYLAAKTYGAWGRPRRKRKLLGIIPLPSR